MALVTSSSFIKCFKAGLGMWNKTYARGRKPLEDSSQGGHPYSSTSLSWNIDFAFNHQLPNSLARLNFSTGVTWFCVSWCATMCYCVDITCGKIHSMLSSLIINSINKMCFQSTVLAFNNCRNNLHVNWEYGSGVASDSIHEQWKLFTILMVLITLFSPSKGALWVRPCCPTRVWKTRKVFENRTHLSRNDLRNHV